MNREKKLLYRKMKKTGLTYRGAIVKGKEARWTRHSKTTKNEAKDEVSHKSLRRGKFGYDYTPLYHFLLSRVGEHWDKVYSEAIIRLDKTEPIFQMVILHPRPDEQPFRRLGESSYFSTLTVDPGGTLVKLDPSFELTVVFCQCCTHTWNGKPVKP